MALDKKLSENNFVIKKPELLSPSANIERTIFSIEFGADAVYAGTNKFGLRYNKNFADYNELKKISNYLHKRNKKLFITVNIFHHNNDIKNLKKHLKEIISIEPDALIFSDPGAFLIINDFLKKYNNKIELHLSTQANTTNFMSVQFWANLGVDRIILARELTLREIYEIKNYILKNNLNIKIETFIHGAMCISYSGRCLLSLYMTHPATSTPEKNKMYRDANRGMCVHPCRWEYKIIEKKRNNEIYDIIEDNNYTYIMSSKDLNMLKQIPLLILAGIDSFKIEGRMKSNLYVAATTLAYRKAIDKAYNIIRKNPELVYKREDFILNPDLFNKIVPEWDQFINQTDNFLELSSHRPYTTGFYFINNCYSKDLSATENKYIQNYKYAGFGLIKIPDSFLHTNSMNYYLIFAKNKLPVNINIKILETNNFLNVNKEKFEFFNLNKELNNIFINLNPQKVFELFYYENNSLDDFFKKLNIRSYKLEINNNYKIEDFLRHSNYYIMKTDLKLKIPFLILYH